MVKVKVKIERWALFYNEVLIEADTIGEAMKRGDELVETLKHNNIYSLELGMGTKSENPSAYMELRAPALAEAFDVSGRLPPFKFYTNKF